MNNSMLCKIVLCIFGLHILNTISISYSFWLLETPPQFSKYLSWVLLSYCKSLGEGFKISFLTNKCKFCGRNISKHCTIHSHTHSTNSYWVPSCRRHYSRCCLIMQWTRQYLNFPHGTNINSRRDIKNGYWSLNILPWFVPRQTFLKCINKTYQLPEFSIL